MVRSSERQGVQELGNKILSGWRGFRLARRVELKKRRIFFNQLSARAIRQ